MEGLSQTLALCKRHKFVAVIPSSNSRAGIIMGYVVAIV